MAHTDACKIQATQFAKKLIDNGLSMNDAFRETERESDGIPASTIKRWWYEIQATHTDRFNNEPAAPTQQISTEIPDNQVVEVKHGGAREGAGAPQKYQKPPEVWSCAIQMAGLAIDQLGRIPADDPKRSEAFQRVILWINENR